MKEYSQNTTKTTCLFWLLIACSMFILFTNLGMLPLWGSEGRWAVISRYMFSSGDIFTPMITLRQYWDKPLLSYWQTLPVAYLFGKVSELTIRIPSGLWAIVMLLLTYDLAKRMLDKQTALISTGVLLTTYGFVFWGRNAHVEMTNATIILLCLWYFLIHQSDLNHRWVYILGICMGIGANMKGLTAYAVPIFCILFLSIIKREWSWVPRFPTLIAAGFVSLLAYLIIPLIGFAHSSSWDPLLLVWRENVVRFFVPFDHKDPFYIYFYRIFDLLAPWSLMLPLALVDYFQKDRYRESQITDILLISAGIFLFFTLSGSRRSYYLLPIIPFMSIFIGDFLLRFSQEKLDLKTDRWIKLIGVFIAVIFALPLIGLIIGLTLKLRGIPYTAQKLFLEAVVLFFCAAIMFLAVHKRQIYAMIASLVLVWLVYVIGIVPWIVEQPRNKQEALAKVCSLNRPIGFLHECDEKIFFYLNKPYVMFNNLKAAHEWAKMTDGVLITPDDLPDSSWKRVAGCRKWDAFVLKQSLVSTVGVQPRKGIDNGQ